MKILVTGAGSRIGQAIIRLIIKSKYKCEIYTSDYFSDCVGYFWAKKFFILPDILKSNITYDLWLNDLIEILNKNKIDIVIPGIDFELKIFSKYKNHIENNTSTKCIVSDLGTINKYNDKYLTHTFLKKEKIDCALTEKLINKKIFFKNNKSKKFVLKPAIGHTSKGLHIISQKSHINKYVKDINNPILQEYLLGDEYTCGTIVQNKEIISFISLRRKLEQGNTKIAIQEFNEQIFNYIYQIVKKSNFFGPINFQLINTKKGPILLEVNPRFSGTSYSRFLFGLNEFDVLYRLINNLKQHPIKLKNGCIIKYVDDFFIKDSGISRL